MSHDHRALEELEQVGHHLLDAGRVGHHLVGDSRDVRDHGRDGPLRIHQRVKVSHFTEAFDAYGTDLCDLARSRPGSGGLEVERHEGDVGEVGVGDLPVLERQQVAGGARAEPLIVPHQGGEHLAADGFGRCRRGEQQTDRLHRIERFSTNQQGSRGVCPRPPTKAAIASAARYIP